MTGEERVRAVQWHLESVVPPSPDRVFVYRSEWLGYLPFGAYHWLEVGGADVTAGMPSGWERNDLFELERRGFLERVLESHAPGDPEDVSITFRLSARE